MMGAISVNRFGARQSASAYVFVSDPVMEGTKSTAFVNEVATDRLLHGADSPQSKRHTSLELHQK